MKLSISTPFSRLLDEAEVVSVRAEDASGLFGILPGHADFLTVLRVSVLQWRDPREQEHFVAVRGGMLSVQGGDRITVATPEAVSGDDLHRLEAEVLAIFRRRNEQERAAHTDTERLRLTAIRQIVNLLRPERAMPGDALAGVEHRERGSP